VSGKEGEMKAVLKTEPKTGIQIGELSVSKVGAEDVVA